MNSPGRSYSAVVKTPPGQGRQATPAPFARPNIPTPATFASAVLPSMHSTPAIKNSTRANIPAGLASHASLSAYSLKAAPAHGVASSNDAHRDSHGFVIPYRPSSATSYSASTPVNPVLSSPYPSSAGTPLHRASSRPETFFGDYFALREEDALAYGYGAGAYDSSEASRAPSIALFDSLRLPEAAIDLTTTSPEKKRKRQSKAKAASTVEQGNSGATSSSVPATNHPLSLSASQREAASRMPGGGSDGEDPDREGDDKGSKSKQKKNGSSRSKQ
ncbi:hypothetical protein QFC20_001955 [Naganishia adeliensis]|uniref:Uncharacterized protein n=1 Tax=Naganishia adeliensis TaxID=92952 RepID=A0ACC2WPB6_9TREE|nr:hypothetical protein QFC20_001955 [Naganishia adeliensis]